MQRVQRLMQQALLVLPFLAQTPQVQVRPLQVKAQVQPAPTGLTHKQLVVVRKQQKLTRQQVSQTPLALPHQLLQVQQMRQTPLQLRATLHQRLTLALRRLLHRRVTLAHRQALHLRVKRQLALARLMLLTALELLLPAQPQRLQVSQRQVSQLLLRLLKQIRRPLRLHRLRRLHRTRRPRNLMRQDLLALHRTQ